MNKNDIYLDLTKLSFNQFQYVGYLIGSDCFPYPEDDYIGLRLSLNDKWRIERPNLDFLLKEVTFEQFCSLFTPELTMDEFLKENEFDQEDEPIDYFVNGKLTVGSWKSEPHSDMDVIKKDEKHDLSETLTEFLKFYNDHNYHSSFGLETFDSELIERFIEIKTTKIEL